MNKQEKDQLNREIEILNSSVDPQTFEHIAQDGDFGKRITNTFALAVGTISYLSGHCATEPIEPFPFDERGVKLVEQYLTEMVKKQVTKWKVTNNRPRPIRVKTGTMMTTSKADAILGIESRLGCAGFVFGQCLAQGLGLKWIESDTQPVGLGRKDEANVQPWNKVRKFCHFGAEDSLIGFYNVVKNDAANISQMQSLLDALRKQGKSIPNDARHQAWHDENGQLVGMIVRDGNHKDIAHVCVR